jgi:DNA-binding transcriptional MerR regulator
MAKELPLRGISAAAREIGISEQVVRRKANAGAIECIRDVTGKRLFTAEAIETFKTLRRETRR